MKFCSKDAYPKLNQISGIALSLQCNSRYPQFIRVNQEDKADREGIRHTHPIP